MLYRLEYSFRLYRRREPFKEIANGNSELVFEAVSDEAALAHIARFVEKEKNLHFFIRNISLLHMGEVVLRSRTRRTTTTTETYTNGDKTREQSVEKWDNYDQIRDVPIP